MKFAPSATASLPGFVYGNYRYPARPHRAPHGFTFYVPGSAADVRGETPVAVRDGFDDVGQLWVNNRLVRTRAFVSSTVAPRPDGEDMAFGSDCCMEADEWEDFTQGVLRAGSEPRGKRWICPANDDEGSVYGHFFLFYQRVTYFLDGKCSNDSGFKLIDSLDDLWWMTLFMTGEALLSFGDFRHIFGGSVAPTSEKKLYRRLMSYCSVIRNRLRELQMSLGDDRNAKDLFGRGGVLQPLFLSISSGGDERWEYTDSPLHRGDEQLKVLVKFSASDPYAFRKKFAILGECLNGSVTYSAYEILHGLGFGEMMGVDISSKSECGAVLIAGPRGDDWGARGDFRLWHFESNVDTNSTSRQSIWYGTEKPGVPRPGEPRGLSLGGDGAAVIRAAVALADVAIADSGGGGDLPPLF